MLSASERSYTRRDTWLFLACLGASVAALFSPATWGDATAATLRGSVLAPLVWLQERAEEGKTARVRLRAVTVQRDSTAYVAQLQPALQAENQRLRQLLGLGRRLTIPYVAAEVLHQAQPNDDRMLLLNAGSVAHVAAFDPVVAPEGVIGVVWNVTDRTSVAMTWAHPEFRVSAFTQDGRVSGIVAPSAASAGEPALEFRSVTYRDTVMTGTLVLSSGLGGIYPKGIPIGTIMGVEREQAGWERVYRLRPAAIPAAAGHVLILTGAPAGSVAVAFPGDSGQDPVRQDAVRPAPARADSIRHRGLRDSTTASAGAEVPSR